MKYLLYILLTVLLTCCATALSFAQCNSSEKEIIIEIMTDNFAYETEWILKHDTIIYARGGNNGTYRNNQLYTDTICVPSNTCMAFIILDEFGDGICCNSDNGYYNIYLDRQLISSGGDFDDQETVYFNCPQGSACNSSDTVVAGRSYSTTYDDHWYIFIPDSTGMYEISSCGLNTCNTEIWMYDNCQSNIDETVAGTTFYDDDNGGCGQQAVISAALEAGLVYYIRVGDADDACSGSVNWLLQFNGPIAGCTDPTACNYNPLATVADTCLYPGNPQCPDGPDLVLRQDVLKNSMYVTNYFSSDACQVAENCINGVGERELIRFTTHIENNGTQDYFIGNPTNQPTQFSNNNCHGHWHYEGYAEYILYSQNRAPIPVGFKSGFCIIDLVCDSGGVAQYGCSNMGITAGCGDIYEANLDCQWIDITDVADGDYTFVARVNWGQKPDALGRQELDYDNNWAQVCFNLSRVFGSPQITIYPNCPIFTDCAGVVMGATVPDCNGLCGGTALMGDLNNDAQVNATDLDLYKQTILDENTQINNCNDIYDDDTINVYDVVLLAQCEQDSHACNFPSGIINIFDTAYISIANADFDNNYIDIALRNPTEQIVAYQFTMSGLKIDTVISLVDPVRSRIHPAWSVANHRILALADTVIERSTMAQPLCRVYFSQLTSPEICIENFESAVGGTHQALITNIEGNCIQPTGTASITNNSFEITTTPNPFSNYTDFNFKNRGTELLTIEIFNRTGQLVVSYSNISTPSFRLTSKKLTSGIYFYRVRGGGNGNQVGKLIIQ